MNEAGIDLEYPILITGGDGTALWNGIGYVGNVRKGKNTTTTAISAGQVVAVDTAYLVCQAPDRSASSAPVKTVLAHRLATTTGPYANIAGVAIGPAAAASAAGASDGGQTLLAGAGSIVPVKCTGTTIDNYLVASSTAGTATSQTTAVGSTSLGLVGKVVKIAGTTGGVTDSGSASYNIGLIGAF